MNDLQSYTSTEFGRVRAVEIDGEPWFVGKDVAEILGFKDTSDAMKRHIDDEDKLTRCFTDSGQSREMYVINESGLYSLILGSKLESARKFKRWITSEVVPSIRRTGGYNLPQTYAEALRALADKAEEAERLQIENRELKPKAEFFDTVADSKTAISMGEVAKVIARKGYGRNNLFEFLRQSRVLDDRNVPYQSYVDKGWFRVIEQHYQKDGEPMISIKTLVYQKGVDGIRKMLAAEA